MVKKVDAEKAIISDDEDTLKKRKRFLIGNLKKIGFPYDELKELGYNINSLLDELAKILIDNTEGFMLGKQEKELKRKRWIVNSREKTEVGNLRSNFFQNFLKESDEKNLSPFLKELLKKYDYERYKNIEFDERGNIYGVTDFYADDFIVQLAKFTEIFQIELYKLIDKIINNEPLSDLSVVSNRLNDLGRFNNFLEYDTDSKIILKIFISFLYLKWNEILLENIKIYYEKGLKKVEEFSQKDNSNKSEFSTIANESSLSKFLNRNKKNTRDVVLKEKLKKIYVYTGGKIKDYSLSQNYPIKEEVVAKIDCIFQNIYFNDEKIDGHKLDYYLTLYRDNYVLKYIENFLSSEAEKLACLGLENHIFIELLKMYEDAYTHGELKQFKKVQITAEDIPIKLLDDKKEKFFEELNNDKLEGNIFPYYILHHEEYYLVEDREDVQIQNRNVKNKNKYVEKIYKVLTLSNIDFYSKLGIILTLIDKFNLESDYTKSDTLKEKYFSNVKPINRRLDLYLSILMTVNTYPKNEIRDKLIKILDIIEKFQKIKPKFY